MSEAGWLCGLSLLGFGLLTAALAAGARGVATVDHRVLEWGYRATEGFAMRSAWWLAVARYGAPFVLRAVVLVVAALQASRRRWQIAGWLVGVVAAENLVAPGAKLLLNRPRPHWLHPIAVEHSLSFPSGHAAGAGMFVTVVVLLVNMSTSTRRLRIGVTSLATLVALTICADRVFLGVHYLSDVVGGVLLGVATALAAWLVLLGVRTRRVTPPATTGRDRPGQ
jgi:undecaprenyl-diphosphatase